MTLKTQHQLDVSTHRTVAYYNQNADDFFAGARDHDVRQNIDSLLQFIEGAAPYNILDYGCGRGRDLKTEGAPEKRTL